MESMACKYREELVGKRFISVRSPVKLKIGKISEWEWRSGIVRAISSRDTSSLDLTVLIEFDDIDWTRREWIRVHDIFQLFLVEHTLVWAERPDPDKPKQSISWPGLSFRAVVDKVGLSGCRRKPVEFLVDRFLGLVEEKEIQIFQEGDDKSHPTACLREEVRLALKAWLDYQDGQKILLTTPTVLVGYRLEVYRAEGTTQWYTAVIQSYNHTSKTLTVTDDTVLEEHNEDPTLIQMHVIDEGVIDSILRGVEIGITPRRRPRAVNKEKEQQNSVTKTSTVSTNQTPTISRAPVQRKPKAAQQTPPHPPPSVTPTPEPERTETSKSTERSNPRLRQLNPRGDRKRKADTPEEQDTGQSYPASHVRKRTKSEETLKPHSPAKHTSKRDLTPSPASTVSESTPPLRVSPRNTPSKERGLKQNQRTSSLRSSTPTLRTSTITPKVGQRTPTPKAEVQRTPTPKAEVQKPPTPKTDVQKPPTPKAEVQRTQTPKLEVQKPATPKVQEKEKEKFSESKGKGEDTELAVSTDDADVNKTKPKTRQKRETKEIRLDSPRNQVVTKTQEQAEPVIKEFSGSEKDKSDKNTCAKSDKLTEKSGKVNDQSSSSIVKPGKYNKNRSTASENIINDQVEEKLKEIRTAFEKEKEKELERNKSVTVKGKSQTSDSVTDKKKSDKSTVDNKKEKSVEKKTRRNERKKEKGKSSVDNETLGDSLTEKQTNKPSKERDKTEVSDDNMHYIKKKQLSAGGFIVSQPQSSGLASSNIDITQSVTDQVARAEKLSSLHGEDNTGSTSSTLSSPNSDTNIDRSETRDIQLPSTQPRDNKAASNSSSVTNSTNTNLSWPHDERSQSRASEERCSSGLSDVGEIRRPSSQADDLKSSKSSAASSPLIVDKSEPVLPYRDPELMSKNPVRSNVPNMHSSQNSYRNERTVHNPIPTQASRPASAGMSSTPLTLSSSHSGSRSVIPSVAYPSPIGLGHTHLSSLMPPGIQHLDPATLAIHQQLAAVQQQQLNAALAQYSGSQFQNAMSLSYPGTLTSTQLEHLWQQKYPSVPIPPPWLLAKHQDDLVRDRLLREQEHLDRLERDRERDRAERDRVERERKERERRLERERLEKERLERERREREKAEQERAERERQEREKLERERQRERQERERAERSRILKESVDSHAAVDQHFSESLRLASQKRAQTGIWPPTPSITLGTGKPKGEPQSLPSTYKPGEKTGEIKPEEKIKQEQLRENDYRHAEMMRMRQQDLMRQKEEYMRQQQQQMLQQHRNAEAQIKSEVKGEPGVKGDLKHNMYGKHEPGSISSGMPKQEGGNQCFSLYGYQPEKCTFISRDQLHSYGLDTKSEKATDSKSVIRSQSPRRSDMSVPPPLIKDTKPQSSVIVENKAKENLKSMSPHAHQQYAAHLHQIAGTPPHGQPKPAHTPERSHERPSPSSTSPGAAYHMNPQSIAQSHLAAMKSEAARQGVSRSQSPLRIASPQQLSAAVMQPMDYRCSPAGGKSHGSPATTSSPHASGTSASVSGAFTHAIAQPPVSLPQSSVAFTYSLIQQGLVPNPIYTHNSPSSKTSSDSQRTVSVTGTARVPHAAHSPHGSNTSPQQSAISQGQKRKGLKEGVNRKRQKGPETQGQLSAGQKALNLSVPVTTPQILTNQSPYTTSSSSTISAPSTTMAQSPMVISQSGAPSSIPSAILSNRLSWNSGFMDSFKTFVETTVQNAFLSDLDIPKNKLKDGQILQQIQDAQQQQQQQQQQQSIPQISVPPRSKSSLERSSTPVTSQQQQPVQNMNTEDHSNLSNSGHGSSYAETINRVANGQIDTDSDTLSAPSPPLQVKQDCNQSPHKSAKHPNLKKAWLQRHSDEDKQEAKPPAVSVTPPPMCPINPMDIDKQQLSDKEKDKDVLKTCYVNCSYISPSKEGGSKSPISAIQTVIPNGTVEKTGNIDESTTSASETETQAADSSANSRKRVKVKKERNPATKKVKVESDDTASNSSLSNSGQVKKKTTSTKKNKDVKTKTNMEVTSEDIKQELEESIVDNGSDEVDESSQSRLSCPSPASSVKEEKYQPRLSEEPMDDVDSGAGNKRKDKKSKKDKKDKKSKKEKEVVVKEEEDKEPELLPLPAPILKETELKAQQSTTFSRPLVRAPMSVLKKTCEPFIQDGSCSEVTPKLMKCRECKMTPTQKNQSIPNIFCRFYAFRRLRYSQRGFLTIDGFSELTDAEKEDIDPWIPKFPIELPEMDVQAAKFIVRRVGEKFCELVEQEKEAWRSAGEEAKIAWKRAVTGVREMCDVCDTTLFNIHWVCHKCGFVVCLDCYKVKAREIEGDSGEKVDDTALQEEQREWLTCSANKLAHDHDKLMLTQIIPSDALWEVNRTMHAMREKWTIQHSCPCSEGKQAVKKNGIKPNLVEEAMKQFSPKKKLVNGIGGEDHLKSKTKNGNIKNAVYHPDSSSPLSLLADVASMDSEGGRERSDSPFMKEKGKHGKSYNPITEPVSPGGSDKKTSASCSTLRELLTKTAGKGGKVKNNADNSKKKSKNTNSLDDIIQHVVEKQMPKGEFEQIKTVGNTMEPMKLMHYTPRKGASSILVRDTPIQIHNLTETSVLYPDVPHSWLCDGRLLRLHDPRHRGNLKIFMEQWRRGQPVLVSGVDKHMDINLWTPQFFSNQFGEIENDLINCRTGCVVVGHPMKHFWDGFAVMEERLVDEESSPMLLKLKDWPPSDDFSDLLPKHFQDLMDALPLPEYTRRDGRLNLVSRLPDFLVKPDLGPKMYIAYGSAQYPKEGTTNLHLDVSDAANVMVHVGFMEEEMKGRQVEKGGEALKAIDKAGCDTITKRRVREVREVPGALWHIFDAVDADKIRDFLNKVGKERGEKIEQHHDPIHDQSWYLDEVLRDRLAKEYGVLGYTIIQCLGDTIFVPAGAPHQVRNLNNCIKVAEDFVSPEHLHHCFRMTQEFRHLSDGHSNHEDKLQVKNIIYHAVKDAIAVLNEHDPEDED